MKLCIEQTPEGFSVYDEMNPEAAQVAATADEALEVARSMLGGGEDQMGEAAPPMEGEGEFLAGFSGPSGY